MTKTLKHRFIAMLDTTGEIPRAELTRRALGQIRQLNMIKLRRMETKLIREGLIQTRSKQQPGQRGPIPQYFSLTEAGRVWLSKENERIYH